MNQEVPLETIDTFSKKVDQFSSQILAQDSIYQKQLNSNNSEILNRVSQSKWFLGILYGFLFALVAGLVWYSYYRKRIEQALRESEEHYSMLTELSPNAIFVHCENKLVFANLAGVRLLGATDPKQILEKPIMDFIHPDYRELVVERGKKIKNGSPAASFIEEKFIRIDGTEVDVEVAGQPFNYQGRQAVQVVAQDITKRKQVEGELKKHRDHLKLLVQERTILKNQSNPLRNL